VILRTGVGGGSGGQWRETLAGTETARGRFCVGEATVSRKATTGTGPAHWYTRMCTLSLTCGPRLPGWRFYLKVTRLPVTALWASFTRLARARITKLPARSRTIRTWFSSSFRVNLPVKLSTSFFYGIKWTPITRFITSTTFMARKCFSVSRISAAIHAVQEIGTTR
jgi:hypothetical protein